MYLILIYELFVSEPRVNKITQALLKWIYKETDNNFWLYKLFKFTLIEQI